MCRFLPSPVAETCVVNMFLPEQQVPVRGSLSEPVMECLLLFVPHSQGSPALDQVAADDLWNHLWVGKSKRHDMQVNRQVFWVLHEWVRSKIKEDTRQTSHADRLCQGITMNQDFQVMSTTNGLTSIFWDPSFTLGDCRMDMTDCQD